MCGFLIPLETRRGYRARQYRLAKRDATQGCCIEATKRMKRVALYFRALNGRIDETQIERSIVADKHSALALIPAHLSANSAKHPLQPITLIDGGS